MTSSRLNSVDAFRGFVMSRMLVGGALLSAVQTLPDETLPEVVKRQFYHSTWHGLTWVDFSFAGFVMLMGLAVRLSLKSLKEAESLRYYEKVMFRVVALFFLGFLYNGGFTEPWPEIRIMGILQRMSLCYLAAAVVYRHTGIRGRIAIVAAILFGYWAILALIPVPGGSAGDYTFDGNLAAWVDGQLLPGKLYYGTWDPEGLLSTLPAIASAVIGILWGDLLLSDRSGTSKAAGLIIAGLVCLNIALVWDMWFPINKSLWTSSYVLITAGLGSMGLGFFYYLMDVQEWTTPFFPFVVIGRNLLVAFLLIRVLPTSAIALRFVGGDVAILLGSMAPFVLSATEVLILWGFLYFLYRHEILIRL